MKEEDGGKNESPKTKKEEGGGKNESPKTKKEEGGAKNESPKTKKEEGGGKNESPKTKKEEGGGKNESPKTKQQEGGGKKESPEVKQQEGGGKKESPEVKQQEGEGKKESPEVKQQEGGNKNESPEVKEQEGGGSKLAKMIALQSCAFLITMILFAGATVMIMLYVTEIENLENRIRAAKRIQAFIGCNNDSFQDANATERFGEAKRLLEYLNQLTTRNDELKKLVNDINGKQNKGWKLFLGNFYFLSERKGNFEVAKKDCENQGGFLTDITSEKEELLVNVTTIGHT
ncbi:uncharacterized protein LOC143819723 isoform X2 [Paroedura picta]|uniref:uncharacterized protein LOC143819723 isoform X2 n=1 Tax=Paroedura picta TaxID=143630 RepID=UPI00405682D2